MAEPGKRFLSRRLFLAQAGAGALALSSCGRRNSPVVKPAAKDPPAPVRFSDITQSANLSFVQKRGDCGMFYYVEQEAAGAALFDADGDGYLDIYFPQPKPIGECKPKFKEPLRHRLYLNNHDGTFRLAPKAFHGVE